MSRKNYLMRTTALILSAILVASPAVIYAGEDVLFEDDTVVVEEASNGISLADDVSFEVEEPLILEEDASAEEQLFVAYEDPSNTEGDSAFFEDPYISDDGAVITEDPYISDGASDIPEDSYIPEGEPDILEDLTVAEDPSLEAMLTITYEPNGGTGSVIIDDNIESGKTYTVKANSFTYDNTTETFLKWNTKADGTGTDYNENYQFKPNENITLYAQWKPAKIGNIYYDTFTDALAAGNNKTVTLIKDVAVISTESVTNTVIVDLNGYTLKSASNFTSGPILNVTTGDLTIVNSSDTDAAISNDAGVGISSSTGLILGRKTTTENNNFTITGTTAAIKQISGTVNINGGNYVASKSGNAVDISASTSTTIEAGSTFSGKYDISIDSGAYGNVVIASALAPLLNIADGDSLVGIAATEGYITLSPLSDALDASTLITLFKDVILAAPVYSVYTSTIDLNGFIISNGSNYLDTLLIVSDGSLTIFDSKGNGALTNTDPSGSAISFVGPLGTAFLTIGSTTGEDFTISANGIAISDDSSALNSVVNVINGTIQSADKAGISSVDSFTMDGGTITAGTNGVEMTSGTLVVNDGTITPGSGKAIVLGTDKTVPLAMSEVTIKSSGVPSISIIASDVNGPIHVYNEGMFSESDVDVAKGSLWVKGSLNEYYSLIAAGTYLTPLQKDADSVYVAGDIEDCNQIIIEKKVSLDLNGRKVTGDDPSAIIYVNGGELTLGDSKGEGLISNTGSGSGVLVGPSSKAVIVLESSEISSVDAVASAVSVDGAKATAIIDSGEFTSKGLSAITVNNGTLEVTGGQFNATNTIDVNSSTFDSVKVDNTVVDIEKCIIPTSCVWVTNGTTSTLKTAEKAFSEADGTIVLTQALASPIIVSKTITLDLNGKAINSNSSADFAIGIEKGGDLTIVNTGSAAGTIESGSLYSIEFLPTGKGASPSLTVGDANAKTNNITITGTDCGIFSDIEGGTTTVNGGKVTGADYAIYNDGGDVTVLDGVLSGDNAISHTDGFLSIKGGSVTGTTYALKIASGYTEGADIEIRGGSFKGGSAAIFDVANAKINSLKVTGGSFDGEINVANKKGFLMGGIYSESPDDILVATSQGYTLKDNTDPSTKALYPYMIVSSVDRYTLNLSASPSDAADIPTSVPANEDPIAKGTSVTVTADSPVAGYQFIGWYEGDTVVSTATQYTFTMEKDTNLTAVYAVPIVVKAEDDTVATGSDYVPDKTKISIVGIEGTGIIDTTNMTMTAATYNKDTSAVGSTHDIVVAGASISKEYAKQYVISGYEKGTLTVVEGTGPETFIADVEKLPAEVTIENLADTRAAVDVAKSDYAQLSKASKDLDSVKTAKAKLDAVEASVIKLEQDKEAADAVTAKIAALPSVDKVTSADKTQADEAMAAYEALSADQKKLISAADKAKLDAVKAAADEAYADDKAEAEKVIALINALPSPEEATPADRTSVDEAKEALGALTENQLAFVPMTKRDKLNDVNKAVTEKEKLVAEEFTAAVNAVPKGKAGTQKALLDKATEISETLTPAEIALISDETISLYSEEVAAFTRNRTFKSGTAYYKVLSNGDVTYLKPTSKTITNVTVPNQVKSGKFLFKVIKVSSNAFRSCDKLQWAVISENVYVLGQYVFARTTSLTTIKILGTGFKSGKVTDAFFKAGKNGNLTVKVPASKVKEYSTLFKNEGKLKGTVKAK
jgi:hypothetical protein